MIELSYADVEGTLAALNRIADDKRVAFKARLKHFQRLGFPPGANTGTGKRVVYSVQMLLKLAFATELTQAGMSPKSIVQILGDNWQDCEASLLFAITPDDLLDHWRPVVKTNQLAWMISPESLRDLSEDGVGEFDYKESVDVVAIADLPSIWLDEERETPIVGEGYRHLVIQLRPFLHRVIACLQHVRPDVSGLDVFKDVQTGLVEAGERLKKILSELDI